jgi:hypothetical protein
MDETRGTFLVTHADADSAVLRDVHRGQVHAVSANPGVETGDVLDATIAPEPPMEVTWRVEEVADRRSVAVERLDNPPSERARSLSADDPGELVTADRDDGELHVLSVPAGDAADAARDVASDDATLVRAARLGASRVEIRAGDGVVSVRYHE